MIWQMQLWKPWKACNNKIKQNVSNDGDIVEVLQVCFCNIHFVHKRPLCFTGIQTDTDHYSIIYSIFQLIDAL